jgi:hypothetical protein
MPSLTLRDIIEVVLKKSGGFSPSHTTCTNQAYEGREYSLMSFK